MSLALPPSPYPENWLDTQARVLDAVGQAVVATDLEGKVVYWNRFAEKLYGWTAAEVLGKFSRDYTLAPESLARLPQIRQVLLEGGSWSGEMMAKNRAGRHFPIAIIVAPVFDEHEQVVAMVGTGKDISEERTSRDRLIRMELQQAAAQQLTATGSWEVDMSAGRVIASAELCRIFGIDPATADMSFDAWRQRLHPEDVHIINAVWKADTLKPGPTRYEHRIVRPCGEVRLLEVLGHFVLDPDGKAFRYYGASKDITEKRAAEVKAREQQERFRELTENIVDAFWMRDAKTREMLYVSPAYGRIWGKPIQTLYDDPSSWLEQVHPDDISWVKNLLLDKSDRQESTYRIIRPDGELRWIHARRFIVRDPDGSVSRYAGVAADITKSKEAELRLKETGDQLQQLSQRLLEVQEEERRHLARELHDEIGQVITATKISLQGAMQGEASERVSRKLQQSVSILDTLLSEVRRLSLDLRPPLLDDLGLMPALRWYLDQTAQRSGLDVHLETTLGSRRFPSNLETAAFRIVQEAVTNILRHAKATSIVVELSAEENLEVVVRDDGRGFDLEEAQSRTQHGGASGLRGMKERVNLLSGIFHIHTAPEDGTEVRASLPLPKAAPRKA